jgi:tetratricopeptide (TPR) repeat protein
MMSTPQTAGQSQYDVHVGGDVGIVGDHGHIGTVNMVTPRRQISWPVAVGSPPPLASAFQPRPAILDKLRQAEGTVVLRQVFTGDGGVGKSQIAAGIFDSAQVDLRVWVAAESRAAAITGYADAAVQLDLADVEVGPEQLARLFLRFLIVTERRCLVVLDDLTDPPDLAGWWPAGQVQVIVTTRRRDAALSGGGRIMVDVGVYTADEADSYLHDRLSPFEDQLPKAALEQAEDLAADLGFLPLGLAQAAAVIIDQGISCAEYRAWFADRARSMQELFPAEADADGYAKTVGTTWALAIDAANRFTPVGLAAPLAHLVAVLDPAGAPEAVYTSQAARDYLAGMVEQDEVPAASARRALRALHRLSLVTHDPDPTEPRAVRMHNLTGRAVLQTLEDERVGYLVQIAAQALVESWPEYERDPMLAETLRANTTALNALHTDALWDQLTGAYLVLFRAGQSLQEVGLVSHAIAHYRRLCDQAEQRLGPDHPDTLTSRNNLAYAYESAGDLGRAIPLFEQTLTNTEHVLGPDDPDTLTFRNNLAYAYLSAGKLGRAIPLFEQTVTDTERALGADHPQTLTFRNNLAGAYESAGDLGRAIPLFEQTLTDRERVLGADHPDTLSSRHNLADAYLSAGDLGRAIPLYEQTVTDTERILGADHPDTLTFRNNLAGAYLSAGDLGRAIPMLEQTLTDRERVLGADHPDTLSSRNDLADAYLSARDLGRAIPLFEQTLTDRQRVLGADHPDTLTSWNNLAYAYQSAGDLDRAIALYEQTLTDRLRVLGADDPDTIASRNNLAGAYESAGDLGRAIALFEQTLTDRLRVLGADHPDTLTSRNNLAGAYQSAGDLGRAIALYEQTLADAERVLGPDHPQTLTSRNNLAYAYQSAGGKAFPEAGRSGGS